MEQLLNKIRQKQALNEQEVEQLTSYLTRTIKEDELPVRLEWQKEAVEIGEPIVTEQEELRVTELPDSSLTHFIYEGDNLDTLVHLTQTGKKVDVIYIDPPYNTGSTKMTYHDNYNRGRDRHSKWLNFMQPRLELAHHLLNEDGVIFLSIDDREFAHLKLLCDQIFGEDNFVTNFSWIASSSTKTNELNPDNPIKTVGANLGRIRETHEYILCYRKSDAFRMGLIASEERTIKSRLTRNGNYISSLTIPKGTPSEIKSGTFWREVGGKSERILLQTPLIIEDHTVQEDVVMVGPWANKIMAEEFFATDEPYYDRKGQQILRVYITNTGIPYIERKKLGEIPVNTLSGYGDTSRWRKELIDILGEQKFDYPKPYPLIQYLLQLHPNKDAVVLDFFAGSGTTGQAVLGLNQEDGGRRQCILATNNENNIAQEVTYERMKRLMEGYTNLEGEFQEGIPANLAYVSVSLPPQF